jgi:hypothetical protein
MMEFQGWPIVQMVTLPKLAWSMWESVIPRPADGFGEADRMQTSED